MSPRVLLHVAALLAVVGGPGLGQSPDPVARPVPRGNGIAQLDVYGSIYLLDRGSALLTQIAAETGELRTVGGQGWGDTEFDRPSGISVENGIDVYVADYGNHRVQRFDRTLNYVSTLFTRDDPDPAKRFGYPTGVALSRLGELFILDGENVRVVKVNRANVVERAFGGIDAGRGRLRAPVDIVVGPADRVYVVDRGRVVVYDTFGNFVRDLMPLKEGEEVRIAVDDRGGVVLQGETLVCFDRDDRIVRTVEARTLAPAVGRPLVDMALNGGRLYLLTDGSLWAVGDPRDSSPGTLEQ